MNTRATLLNRLVLRIGIVAVMWWCSSVVFGQSLSCKIGPLNKVFGGSNWLVYACDDDRSIVIVTAPGNPAMPFYFAYFPENDSYRLTGEGTGNKSATKAAFEELKDLSISEIRRLVEEAKDA